jgi:hypothetical protein
MSGCRIGIEDAGIKSIVDPDLRFLIINGNGLTMESGECLYDASRFGLRLIASP